MSDLYEQIVSQRGTLANLAERIPGFGGYMERSARRTADRMLRDYVAAQLQQRIGRLIEIEKALLDDGGLSYMSKTSSIKTKIQTFRDRVKTATPGYSGLFDKVSIGPDELEHIYSFDEAQLRYIDRFDEALNVLAAAQQKKEAVNEAIAALDLLAVEANDAFDLRDNLLTEIGNAS